MSIESIVARGYGSFGGGVNFIPTRGYGNFSGAVVAVAVAVDADGKKRTAKRRVRLADEDLTIAEVQFMQRKLRELREAKSTKERQEAEQELAEAMAPALQSEETIKLVAETVAAKRPSINVNLPSFNARELGQDLNLISSILKQLSAFVQEQDKLRRNAAEEEAIVMLLLI